MPTLLTALASALLLAALVTESTQRFWPDSYVALLVITFAALLVNGLFNARLKSSPASTNKPSKDRASERSGSSQRRGNTDKRGANKNANRGARADKPARERETGDQSAEIAPRGPQETGTVKWFNRSKGYGFIIRDNGDEVFVHQRSIVNTGDRKQRPMLRDGQKVSFVVAHLDKGAQAEQVNALD